MPAFIHDRPEPGEYSPFYAGYVSSVPAGDLIAILERAESRALLGGLSDEAARKRYAPGKWSVKEVVGHIADTERVMAYRALRFGRGDPTPLAGFEQEDFVRGASWDDIPLAALLDDLELVRGATVSLLRGFSGTALARQGTASNSPVTVRALAAIIAGHERHHLRILRERYLA